ncbi:lycopene beta-cyclase CrtY [Ramlibacter pallidus]|uniref:Lycopene beta-cyclase CrtY n=1 Tax=Ramlibacter pallidus TaxID=2780087 RepID=A0ABR9S703_9BURK|nr:lycopene beta-cyclase CrtY [Ramlibacter pallidus]
MNDADLVLVGGGLANGLIAWRLRQLRPDLRVLVLEAGPSAGGNHTWSFHATDLEDAQQAWLAPLVAHRWASHAVRFPALQRHLRGGYASITSARFDEVLRRDLGASLRPGVRVLDVRPQEVTLDDGSTLRAGAVIDGRGRLPEAGIRLGWQKFIGREFRLEGDHGLDGPVLMDATVPQRDGYRFVYTLPLDARTVLVEDTYYADGAALEPDRVRRDIDAYVQAQGWRTGELLREEQGVLPIVLDGDPRVLWDAAGGVPRTGLSAALFHPTTGYSLPDAVRVADLVARLPDLRAGALFAALRGHALAQWRDQAFFRLLNRMLFQAAVPTERWRVMQRFYGLPEPLVARFYAGRPTLADKLRIVSGKPPVPLAAALQAALGRRAPTESFT